MRRFRRWNRTCILRAHRPARVALRLGEFGNRIGAPRREASFYTARYARRRLIAYLMEGGARTRSVAATVIETY
jgi:hypothetical protein